MYTSRMHMPAILWDMKFKGPRIESSMVGKLGLVYDNIYMGLVGVYDVCGSIPIVCACVLIFLIQYLIDLGKINFKVPKLVECCWVVWLEYIESIFVGL